MWSDILPSSPIRFDGDFLWGVGSSAFQSEGGPVPNDWTDLAEAGRVPRNPGNGFWDLAESDMALVAGLGFQHYRISVEWSRVEPEKGYFDERAIDRYVRICEAAHAAGITPWVNFFHFTHPSWLVRDGGLLAEANHDHFVRYVERLTRALKGRVSQFHTQNESQIYALCCYRLGIFPPFVADRETAYTMTKHVLSLHARAFEAIKSVDPQNEVTTIESYLDLHPTDPQNPAAVDNVREIDTWYNGAYLEALATGILCLPDREPVEIPGIKNAVDRYGFNWYHSTGISEAGFDDVYGSLIADHPDPPIDEMGRAVNPAGMERGLTRVAEALPGVPIVVCENGCPTRDEDFRIRYVASHLAVVDRLRKRGLPIHGYFHWTAVDNYEWLLGFGDERFGLIAFDPETRKRTLKKSALWMQEMIRSGVVDPGRLL